ncbi:MAG: alpha/beta hydrolase, partial [Alphaproteobacteria bacterium]|nr:alpha/beta hydrolase [Alphaproteobacteria bacterium]
MATNGIELSVHLAGPETGPAVLLVHGWPELAHSWKHQIPALADAGYRVIAPDLRGFGGSDCPPDAADYGIDELVGDLTGLLDALGHDQAIFVGHDWGGIIVWHAAMLAAERVAGVIGVNTPHLPRGSEPPL